MGTPLTPEEKSVMRVLASGRPKRNLHVYALMAVGLFFLAMALWKGLSRSSDPASRVSERPGPKAPAEEPSPATLRELLQKQSTGGPGKPDTSEQAKAPQPGVKPPPGVITLDDAPKAPVTLPMTPDRGTDVERKLVEASFMTAKTEVYVQATAAAAGAMEAKADAVGPPVTTARSISAADTLARALETRMPSTSKPGVDELIAARVHEQENFLARIGRGIHEPQKLVRAASPMVAEGTSIPAVLTHAITSDLPGPVEAMVTSDVYDSSGGGRLLLPKGSRMVGSYNSAVAMGQDRLQVVFTRLRLPSGASVGMESSPATDGLGRTGAQGEVENHYLRMLGSAVAMGLITLAVERRVQQRDAAAPTGAVNIYGSSAGSAGGAAAQAFGNVTNQLLERNLGIGPTIRVPAGSRIRVRVVRDLAIPPEVAL